MTMNLEEELKDRLRTLIEAMIGEGRRTTMSWGWTFVFWGVAYYIAIAWTAYNQWPWAWLVTMLSAWIPCWLIIRQKKKSTPQRRPETTIGRAVYFHLERHGSIDVRTVAGSGVQRQIQPAYLCGDCRRHARCIERRIHEIVHNRYVVEVLKAKGAVFVEELAEIPDTKRAGDLSRPMASPNPFPPTPRKRDLLAIDATCPLGHQGASRGRNSSSAADGAFCWSATLAIPEVVGTMGQLPEGAVILVESVAGCRSILRLDDQTNLAYVDPDDALARRFAGESSRP